LPRRIPIGLLLAGDLGQRIFQQPFSWKSLGVDVRGPVLSAAHHYRRSHQIRSHADQLLPTALADMDGNMKAGAARSRYSMAPTLSSRPLPTWIERSQRSKMAADRIAERIPRSVGIRDESG
jgi:hypothetical protein